MHSHWFRGAVFGFAVGCSLAVRPAGAQQPPPTAPPATPGVQPPADPGATPPATPGTAQPTPMPPVSPGGTVPPLPSPAGPSPQAADADPSVQFPSSPARPPDPASTGQPLSNPYDWNMFRLGGQYRIEADANNFPFHPTSLSPSNAKQQAFVQQRFRTWLTYSPTQNVEGYIQMQVGGINWGTDYDFSKNFGGAFAPPGDRVGVQLRRAWMAYKDEDVGKFRVGFLDWHDSFNDTLASSNYDFNTGGIDWTRTVKSLNDLRLSAAALVLSDTAFAATDPAPPTAGTHNAYLFAFDADQPLLCDKKLTVGGSAYYLYDRGGYSYPTAGPYNLAQDVWLGARVKWANDVVPVGAFILSNNGTRSDVAAPKFSHAGWSSWVEVGPVKLPYGKLSAQILYASGGTGTGGDSSHEFRTIAQSYRDNFGSQGYWSYLQVTSPNGPGDVADLGVGAQNQGLGLFTVQAKYEYPITKRLTGTTAAGWLKSAQPNPANTHSVIGTEVGQMFTYDFGGGLKLDTGAAVLFAGDFYQPSFGAAKQDTLYEAFSRLQLEF